MSVSTTGGFGLALLGLVWLPAIVDAAATIDDPRLGGRSSFTWEEPGSLTRIDGFGADDGVSDEHGNAEWALVLDDPGFISITVGGVYNRPPTYFDLLIDGAVTPWTSYQITPQVISVDDDGNPIEHIHYFDALLIDNPLGAGLHTFTLRPDAFNTDGTTGTIEFSGVTTPVPLPPAALLLGSVIALLARRTRPK